MLLHCLSNDVYKNLARGPALYFYSQCYPCSADLLLQCVFFPSKNRNYSSEAVNASRAEAVPTAIPCSSASLVCKTFPSHVPHYSRVHSQHPKPQHLKTQCLVMWFTNYRLKMPHWVEENLSSTLKHLMGQYSKYYIYKAYNHRITESHTMKK